MHLLNSHNVYSNAASCSPVQTKAVSWESIVSLLQSAVTARIIARGLGVHSVSVSQCVWIRALRRSGGGSGMFGLCGHRSMCMRQWCASYTVLKAIIHSRPQSSGFMQCKKKKNQNVTDLISLKRILNCDLSDLWFKVVSLPKKAEGSSSFCSTSDTNYRGDILIPSWHRSVILRNTIRQVKPSTKNSMLYKLELDWSYATVSSHAIRCGFQQLPRQSERVQLPRLSTQKPAHRAWPN